MAGTRGANFCGSVGSTLGGLTLPWLWELQAQAKFRRPPVTDKSVVFLFLQGGPSQFETFDPKMSAPSNVRSATGEIATSLPGVTYGSTFERLAKLAHKTTIVRSFRTGDANHNIKPVVCKETLDANLGSLYARIAGTNDPTKRHAVECRALPAGCRSRHAGRHDEVRQVRFRRFAGQLPTRPSSRAETARFKRICS